MIKKYLAFTVAAGAIFLNLVIPACGSKNNNPTGNYATLCSTGQSCVGSNTGSGVSLLNSPGYAMSTIDSYGSMVQLGFYATNYTAGQSSYSGTINIQGQVYISPSNPYGCPPGTYSLQGQANFGAGYGGTIGAVSGSLTGSNGFQVRLNGEIYQGQDPYMSQQTGYYYQGSFANSCDSNASAL